MDGFFCCVVSKPSTQRKRTPHEKQPQFFQETDVMELKEYVRSSRNNPLSQFRSSRNNPPSQFMRVWVFELDLTKPLYSHDFLQECGAGLSFVLGVCKGDWARQEGWTGIDGGDYERGVCLGNFIFYGVLRVGLLQRILHLCTSGGKVLLLWCWCGGRCIWNEDNELKLWLKCLLLYEWGDAKFNHCDVWVGETV